jgi:tryptophanyl-tRNA synthetase
METKQRVFSGIQPSGNLHVGNYVGALKNWVAMQDEYENFFCIVDLHAITVPQDPEVLRQKIQEVAAIYLASGLDPERCVIFRQSMVSAHAELCWLLNCVARFGELSRMTQFKDKTRKGGVESASAGLFDYPVLQAADVLLYNAHLVPVGEDQRQHLELMRTLARRFNHLYGETFVVPEAMIPPTGARVMALDAPEEKMSKSSPRPSSYVAILDDPDAIRKKIRRAKTDSGTEITASEDKPTSTLRCPASPSPPSRPATRARAMATSRRTSPRWSWTASHPSGTAPTSCSTTPQNWTVYSTPARDGLRK